MDPSNLLFKIKAHHRICIHVAGALCYLLFGVLTLPFICVACLYSGGVYAFLATLPRDLLALYRFAKFNIYMWYVERKRLTVPRIFDEIALKQPDKICMRLVDGDAWTYRQVADATNKFGGYFRAAGYKRGDCIALLMETRLEYACIWLGLAKLGIKTALINSQLRQESLRHCVQAAGACAIIVSNETAGSIAELKELDVPVYLYGAPDPILPNAKCLQLATLSAAQLTQEMRLGELRDQLIYVYTSGTTGMPKAAVITHTRCILLARGAYYMLNLRPDDIIYDTLPLYHTAGGIIGVGQALLGGATVVLRKKFSARNFWTDCQRYDCTVAQYIGELCRYLLATDFKDDNHCQHKLRLMYGNGLRPQIWSRFVARFRVPHIAEVYGATESNANLTNMVNRVGAVGFVPVWARSFAPVQLIRCDDAGLPLRNASGYCIPCKPGQSGLFIGKVDPRRSFTAYHGYADRAASEKKLLKSVFSDGDVYFNSGDIMISDDLGYYYFMDRTGDTFRWRGENVATQEVEGALINIIGLSDCVVYGVDVPHMEGKAGMAAIADPERKVDLTLLAERMRERLPAFARPVFVRIMPELPRTSTFKLKKSELMSAGFNINQIEEPLYYLTRQGCYEKLDQQVYDALQNGTAII